MLSLGFPRHAVPRPTRINSPHQFFGELNGFIEGCFSRRRRLTVGRQSTAQEYRGDYAKSSLPSLIHWQDSIFALSSPTTNRLAVGVCPLLEGSVTAGSSAGRINRQSNTWDFPVGLKALTIFVFSQLSGVQKASESK